jgi:HSP20 family protein
MNNLTRYEPFEDFFKGFFVRPFAFPTETGTDIKIDVKEGEKEFLVEAEIPGMKKEDIFIDVDGDTVSLRAGMQSEKEEKKGEKIVYSERSYGMVSRSFTLPVDVDDKAVKAEYKDGVLKLVLPKKSNGAGRRITVS